jgi:hypothetical protein
MTEQSVILPFAFNPVSGEKMSNRKTANSWVLGFNIDNCKPNGTVHAFSSYEDALYFRALNNGTNNISLFVTYNFSDMINYCGMCGMNAKTYLFQK